MLLISQHANLEAVARDVAQPRERRAKMIIKPDSEVQKKV
jgi:hypothetical protein